MYGGPSTTKFLLEDTFNHLRHVSQSQNKGRAHMAKSTQYFYAATSPSLKSFPSPTVDFETFQTAFTAANQVKSQHQEVDSLPSLLQQTAAGKEKKSRHRPGQHPLPKEFGSKQNLLKLDRDWKAAGYHSNRVATAACFYLMEDHENKWANATKAWSAMFFLKRHVYVQPAKDLYAVSLGFFGYAAQGALLVKHCVGDKVGVLHSNDSNIILF